MSDTKSAISVESVATLMQAIDALKSEAEGIIAQLNETGGVAPVWTNIGSPPNTIGGFKSGESATPPEGLDFAGAMNKLLFPSIAPSISLTLSGTIPYLAQIPQFQIAIDTTVLTTGATLESLVLEWKRKLQPDTSYRTISVPVQKIVNVTFDYDVHAPDLGNNTSNDAFTVRVTATDSLGGVSVNTKELAMQGYLAPSLSHITPSGMAIVTYAGEVGSVNQSITKAIIKNRVNTTIDSAKYEILVDGIVAEHAPIPLSGNFTVDINNTVPNVKDAKSVSARIIVTDSDVLRPSSQNPAINIFTATLKYKQFFGASDALITHALIRGFASADEDVNTFTLNTGNTAINYHIAIPVNKTLVSVMDADASGVNITSRYALVSDTFSLVDAGGTLRGYKLYTMINGVPYSSNHRHIITVQ